MSARGHAGHHNPASGRKHGRHRPRRERASVPYAWLGAGVVGLGIAAVGSSAVAQADSGPSTTGDAGPSKDDDQPAAKTTNTAAAATQTGATGSQRTTPTTASPKKSATTAKIAPSTKKSDIDKPSAATGSDAGAKTPDQAAIPGATTIAPKSDTGRRGISTATESPQTATGSTASVQPATPSTLAATASPPRRHWILRKFFNLTPTISVVPGQTTQANGTIKGTVRGEDGDGDTLGYAASKPANGSVVVSANGAFVYTPGPKFGASGDTFTITASDDLPSNGPHVHGPLGFLIPGFGSTATVSVSIAGRTTTPTNPTTPTDPTTPTNPTSPGTAAARLGWGTPSRTTVFSSAASLSANGWGVYNSPGHAGYGRRTPAAVSFNSEGMVITGDPAGNTGGMAWMPGQKYGSWEVRIKVPPGAADYQAVALLWPDAENFPVGGEMDFFEMTNDATRQRIGHFLHYSAQNRTEWAFSQVDATQWHHYAVSWTPQKITYYVDGNPVFTSTDTSHFPPGPMHLALQLDATEKRPINLAGGARMQIAWARMYPLSQID